MFILPDRTRQEGEIFRVLRDELKRRKSNEETKLVIRNDKNKSSPLNSTVHTPALPTQI